MGFFKKVLSATILTGAAIGSAKYVKKRMEELELGTQDDFEGFDDEKIFDVQNEKDKTIISINKRKAKYFADRAADKVIDVTENVKDKVGEDKINAAKDKFDEVSSIAKEKANEAKDKVVETIGDENINNAKEKMSEVASTAKDKAAKVAEIAKDKYNEVRGNADDDFEDEEDFDDGIFEDDDATVIEAPKTEEVAEVKDTASDNEAEKKTEVENDIESDIKDFYKEYDEEKDDVIDLDQVSSIDEATSDKDSKEEIIDELLGDELDI